jgi:hypothetical protein
MSLEAVYVVRPSSSHLFRGLLSLALSLAMLENQAVSHQYQPASLRDCEHRARARRGKGGGGEGKGRNGRGSTSEAVVIKAFQSILGSMLYISFGFGAMVSDTSSHSFGWRGKEAEDDLQAFTAQVRKLRVRIFILCGGRRGKGGRGCGGSKEEEGVGARLCEAVADAGRDGGAGVGVVKFKNYFSRSWGRDRDKIRLDPARDSISHLVERSLYA